MGKTSNLKLSARSAERKSKIAEDTRMISKSKAISKAKQKPSKESGQKNGTSTNNKKLNKQKSTEEGQFRPKLYFAAALFATRECIYNIELAQYIEDKGYPCMVPQRDGFEFNEHCQRLLHEYFPDIESRSKAFSWVIYLIDLGKFLYESDVIIANMDEPLDPGVLVECMIAKEMGKPIIQYRTDSRNPYGNTGEFHKGMHFFPLFPCDHFVYLPTLQFGSQTQVENFYNACTEEIHNAIQDVREKAGKQDDKNMTQQAKDIVRLTKMMLKGAPDLEQESSLRRIFENYIAMSEQLEKFQPKLTYRMQY